jgi:putative membrane protein
MNKTHRLLIALGTNALALWVANRLFSGVRIHGWAAYLIGAAALGFANAILKPVLAILTLPLVIATLGFFMLVIDIAMVAFAAWVAPNFSIHGIWTYVGTVVVVWLANWMAHAILDRTLDRRRGWRRLLKKF